MTYLVVVSFLLGMLLDGVSTSESIGSTTCFWEASYLVPPSMILPPYWTMVVFSHFDWFVFMRILFYDAYHVIPHPPMKFQADTLSFGWILEVVTFQLPLVFHTISS
jgi:hypothetical protein